MSSQLKSVLKMESSSLRRTVLEVTDSLNLPFELNPQQIESILSFVKRNDVLLVFRQASEKCGEKISLMFVLSPLIADFFFAGLK